MFLSVIHSASQIQSFRQSVSKPFSHLLFIHEVSQKIKCQQINLTSQKEIELESALILLEHVPTIQTEVIVT